MLTGIADKLPVDPRPALGVDLIVEVAADINVGANPELLGDEILRPRPHALADVVPRDDEVLPVVGAAAQDDVDVRVVGIPVIDADPIEFGSEVLFDLAHEVARIPLQVGHVGRVFGRDDEPEMMPVVLAALGKALHVGIVGLRPEHARLLAVARHAFAAKITEMCLERRAASIVPNDPRLDGGETRVARQQPIGLHAGDAAAAEARGARRPDPAAARDLTAGLLRGGERLGDEGLRPLDPARADAAWPDAEVVLAAHGPMSREVRFSLNGLRNCRVRGLRNAGAHRGAGTKTLARSMPRPSPDRAAHRGLLSCPPTVVLPLPSRLALFLAPGFASFRLFATRFIVRDPCSCDG